MNKIYSVYRIFKDWCLFWLFKQKHVESYNKSTEYLDIVKQIQKNSFAVIPNYYTAEQCKSLRDEIDRLIEKRKVENSLWVDDFNADHRCFAAEDDSMQIAQYCNDPFLLSVAENYFNGKMACSNTLAAKIVYADNNIGSGQGWHRDGNNFQFKAILYLSDVELKDGPFQIIKGSHKLANVIEDTLVMDAEPLKTRFSDTQIEKLIDNKKIDYAALTAKAGTLVFADVSSIHTGMTLSEGGCRYTLFNYYYPSYDDIEHRKNTFKNVSKYM